MPVVHGQATQAVRRARRVGHGGSRSSGWSTSRPVARSPHSTSDDVVGGEVVAGAPVAGRGAGDPGPVVAAEQTGWPGPPSYAARASDVRAGAGREHPADHAASTSGRSTRVTSDGVGVGGRERGQPGAQRRAHALGPVRRRPRRVTSCPSSSARAPRRPRRRAPPSPRRSRRRASAGHRAQQPRAAVVVAHQRLGRAHPGAGAGGEQESVQAHRSASRAGTAVRRRRPAYAARGRRTAR